MGNKSFEGKLNNASHEYKDGTHYATPHPDANSSNALRPTPGKPEGFYSTPDFDTQEAKKIKPRKPTLLQSLSESEYGYHDYSKD